MSCCANGLTWCFRTLCVALFIFQCQAYQEPSGIVSVEVRDESGAAVQAKGRLEDLTTGMDRRFETNARGNYTLDHLPFGSYRLQVSRKGFTAQSTSVNLKSTEPAKVSITLGLESPSFQVNVVAATPLPGVNVAIEDIPAPVQAATAADIKASNAINLSDFLNHQLNGVYLNEVQSNPFQPDLNYRGYTASPLLGTPQGISVYMDGVRLNQPFGDVVGWDLIPPMVISEVTLIPSSNPIFGLNTLGGAISLETKDGRNQPGTTIQASGGTFGRRAVEFEHGGSRLSGVSWYVAGNLFHEDGWRVESSSHVRQGFSKLGWQHGKTTLSLTGAYADNALFGNGLQEQRFLSRDYTSAYTLFDVTKDRSPFVNFAARHSPTTWLTLSGNAYFRYIRSDTFNADLNQDSLDQAVYQPSAADIRALSAAGYTGFPLSGANAANTPFPSWRCIAQALQNDEPAEKCNGLDTNTYAKQHNYGFSGLATLFGLPRGHRNQFAAGLAYDRSSVTFQQASQFGYLNPDRSITTVAAFADGSTNLDGVPFDTRVSLRGLIHTWSVYATNTLSVSRTLTLTLSGRYNRTTIDNADRISPAGGPGSLNGIGVYSRLNPAVGFTYSPIPVLSAYASYNEGSRAPTSIELGCADATRACKLPNAMAGDPPLKQVVTKTWEAGLRNGQESKLHWSAGFFRGENHDDILFVASEQNGFGYFKNFGQTRRQGAEVSINSRIWRVTIGGGYTYLDATYQSAETVNGSNSSANDAALAGIKGVDGTIQIQPGNRIPLAPGHILKAHADIQATSKLWVGLSTIAASRSYARGNENNVAQEDGTYYLGPGVSAGYALLNLGAHYQLHRHLQLFVQINNLFDRHYYTAAQLGATGFDNNGNFVARPFGAIGDEYPIQHATFYAPGAPRAVFGGIRFSF